MFTQLSVKYKSINEKNISQAVKKQKDLSVLYELQSSQVKNGLGDPGPDIRLAQTEVASLSGAEELGKHFKLIHMPNVPLLTAHDSRSVFADYASGPRPGFFPPKVVLVRLSSLVSHVHWDNTWFRSQCDANIPVMPSSVQALAIKAREVIPEMQFYLLYLPQWKPGPQKDPYLLGYVDSCDQWVEIAWWGGDKDLLQKHVEEKK